MAHLFDTTRPVSPRLVQLAAALCLAIGLGYWLPRLFAPTAAIPPAAFHDGQPETASTERIAAWFGGPALKVHVAVTGLLAGSRQRAAALLSVNAEPARAYRLGDEIAPGVVLHGISATGVVLEHDGTLENIIMQAQPDRGQNGFIHVPANASGKP
jgi:general secretion pathway protein C